MCVRRGSQVPRILWLGGGLAFAPACLTLAAVSGAVTAMSRCADAKPSESCLVCSSRVGFPYSDVVCPWHDQAGGTGEVTPGVDFILDLPLASDRGRSRCTRVAGRGSLSASVGFADHPVGGWLRLCVKRALPSDVERSTGKSDLVWVVPSLGRSDPVAVLKRIWPGGKESISLASLTVHTVMARAPPPRSVDPR